MCLVSSCCGKGLVVISDDADGTCYYICEACNNPCDHKLGVNKT